ncbi:hypothetical protein SELMODRAFT_168360 [Selaginella moellendorffii]|uniref:Uncharacterized protein n=1 Tax=Selaginella moellendorffii TaxID=88036 RepID=D8R6N9_SELML|nr:mitochondrial uncoupling protein 4 [Selaginella moellendorffii]EFJ32707.1 hypothetical protein SELMODRAFT_168360 [Selaginella moellendorffii]|eukprot:XP_024526838.1 mitochondrial uncoupling protein 4 [Selaginella moellendorffii]
MGWKAFVEGGAASIVAGSMTHPLDLIKVRMQLPIAAGDSPVAAAARTGPLSVGIRVLQTEGAKALFSGVSAAILRQGLYSTTRLGLYDAIKEAWREKRLDPSNADLDLAVHKKFAAGLIAGGIGAAVGNPADVALVRMQGDGRLPVWQRRRYLGVGDALARIARQEGIGSLWTGSGPTIQRAMIVTAAQLTTYDQSKEFLAGRGICREGLATHVGASLVAGFVASVASNPVDVIKTRVMSVGAGDARYSGSLDCAIKTVRGEGAMALYRGFLPTLTRQAPFSVVLFVTLEQIKAILKDF